MSDRQGGLEEILMKTMDVMSDGAFFADERGILVFSNTAADPICLGGRCKPGEPFFSQCQPEIRQKLHDAFHDFMIDPSSPVEFTVELNRLCIKGVCRANIVDDEFAGMIGIVRDVTERRRFSKIVRHVASVDPLTRLFNRRHFHIKLRDEARRARRQRRPLSLVIFDLDTFKEINDTYGHLKGDMALKSVAEIIKENTRKDVDVACRYGGDEFAMILPETDLDQAAAIAWRIREEISSRVSPPVTVSGGVAELGEHEPEEFLHIADRAMYRAKRLGGDLVFVEHEKQGV